MTKQKMKTVAFEHQGKKKRLGGFGNIRGCDGFSGFPSILPLLDRFNKANDTHVRIPKLDELNYILTKQKIGDKEKRLNVEELMNRLYYYDSFPAQAMIIYNKSGKAFGSEVYVASVNYVGITKELCVPTGCYKGEKGIALVVPDLSPDDFVSVGKGKFESTYHEYIKYFNFPTGDSVYDYDYARNYMYSFLIDIPDNRFIVIPDFPSKDGWYLPHDATGIPHGKRLDSPIDNPEARYLLRGKCCHIALLNFFLSIESDNPFIDIWHTKKIIKNRIGVNARGMVTDPFSVGVVFPEEELDKVEKGHSKMMNNIEEWEDF
ncbi:hypothetical protein KAW38_05105 [Candidatus Micrarchaeota archaeon]|nr:hypothetical protein [Candidatus Micrarchaeota archaeon]